jgi:hypothetical protein
MMGSLLFHIATLLYVLLTNKKEKLTDPIIINKGISDEEYSRLIKQKQMLAKLTINPVFKNLTFRLR